MLSLLVPLLILPANNTSINDFYSSLSQSDLAWRDSFLSEFHEKNTSNSKNKAWLTEEEFNEIKTAFLNPNGIKESIKSEHDHLNIMKKTKEPEDNIKQQANKVDRMARWKQKYEFINNLLVLKRKENEPLQSSKVVVHVNQFFEIIYKGHRHDGACASILHSTHNSIKVKHGTFISNQTVRMFCKNCHICRGVTETIAAPPAGSRPIVAKIMLEQIQMDCIDMQNSVSGLEITFERIKDDLPKDMSVPRYYILNIADHASKVGQS